MIFRDVFSLAPLSLRALAMLFCLAEIAIPQATMGAPQRSFQGPPGGSSLAWSSDGKLLAAGGKDTSISVWPIGDPKATAQVLRRNPPKNPWQREIIALAFSHDGNFLASGGWDGTITLWDIRSSQVSKSLLGHSDPVHGLAFSPDGGRLASTSGGANDYTLRLWDTSTGSALQTVQMGGVGYSVAFSGDGRLLAAVSWETVHVYRVDGMVKAGSFIAGNKHQAARVVTFSPDGKTIATAGDEGIIRAWSPATRTTAFRLDLASKSFVSGSEIRALRYCEAGSTLTSVAGNGTVREWNVGSHTLIKGRQIDVGKNTPIESAAIDGNCDFLAVATPDGSVRLWQLRGAGPAVANTDELAWLGR